MVYAVPLADGSFGFAQAGETQEGFVNVIYVALFLDRHSCIPDEPPCLRREQVVSLAATWRKNLNRGDWRSVGMSPELFAKLEFPNEAFAEKGYVGARNYDAGILTDFLSACHGLLPWNVMHDPEYYDHLLCAGVARPRSALVLSESAREDYRRNKFKIGT